jgi:hypothetical protein
MLEEAFKAFYRRAAEGAGDQSGYPRYKRSSDAGLLPLSFSSGCRMVPSNRPNRNGAPIRRWRLKVQGVTGSIRVRGELPAMPLRWLDAEIRERNGDWWLSVCVEVANRRDGPDYPPDTPPLKSQPHCGGGPATIRFDLVDVFARVSDGVPPPPTWGDVLLLQEECDALLAECDTRYPRKPGQRPSRNRQRMLGRIGKQKAYIARVRRERLHEWTTAVVSQCSSLTVYAPAVKEATRTAKGDEFGWGAAVDIVADLNRHVLSQAPAVAIAMLEYKAKEAGIASTLVRDESPVIAVGHDVSTVTKVARRARRKLQKEKATNVHYQDARAGEGGRGARAAD